MHVLLVEDSRILRNRLRAMINAIPESVVVAETDNEADARCCLEKYQPELAVLDLRLRSGSGLSVLEHIKATYPATIVIVLTNYGQQEYHDKCIDLGADYFFDKSRDIEAFIHLLEELQQSVFLPVQTDVVQESLNGLATRSGQTGSV